MIVIEIIVGMIIKNKMIVVVSILNLVLLNYWCKIGMIIVKLMNLYIIDGILINSLIIGWVILWKVVGKIFVIVNVIIRVNGRVMILVIIVILKEVIIIGRVL